MANSLQDQLLKAGLVNEQQLKQAKTKKRKQKRAGGGRAADDAERGAAAERAAAAKRERDQELNRRREAERQRKAELVALWQLVRDNRVSRDGGDVAYNFADGSALKRLYVKAPQQKAIADGELAIVRHDDFYELVPAAVAERAEATDPNTLVLWNKPGVADPDDPYADFEVPDDLMW
ncbi:MAG: DUF2058 domain-containing protein [Thiohalocapsa sp.]|jgi:hypothetical protein